MKTVPSTAAFLALDFETADYGADSACAVAAVKVVNQQIVKRVYCLIRPPRPTFEFTYIHGITWADVSGERSFPELWPDLSPLFAEVDFVAAHNASFDRRVLRACCESAGAPVPSQPFVCTVQVARKVWSIFPTKLPNVCDHLNIELNHHDALSDAEACARIVMAASKERTELPVSGRK